MKRQSRLTTLEVKSARHCWCRRLRNDSGSRMPRELIEAFGVQADASSHQRSEPMAEPASTAPTDSVCAVLRGACDSRALCSTPGRAARVRQCAICLDAVAASGCASHVESTSARRLGPRVASALGGRRQRVRDFSRRSVRPQRPPQRPGCRPKPKQSKLPTQAEWAAQEALFVPTQKHRLGQDARGWRLDTRGLGPRQEQTVCVPAMGLRPSPVLAF